MTGVVSGARVHGIKAIAYDRSYGGGLRSFKFYISIFFRCLNTLPFFDKAIFEWQGSRDKANLVVD